MHSASEQKISEDLDCVCLDSVNSPERRTSLFFPPRLPPACERVLCAGAHPEPDVHSADFVVL